MKKYFKYSDLIILSILPLLLYGTIDLLPLSSDLLRYSIHLITMFILSIALIKHFYLHKYKRKINVKQFIFYFFIIIMTTLTSYLIGLVYQHCWSLIALVFYNLTYLPWLYALVLYGYRRKNDIIPTFASIIVLILAQIALWFMIHPVYNKLLSSSLKTLYFFIGVTLIVGAGLFVNEIFESHYQNTKNTWMYNALLLTSSLRILVIFIYLFYFVLGFFIKMCHFFNFYFFK